MRTNLVTAAMPGQVWGLAAADPGGPLYVTSSAGREIEASVALAAQRRDLLGRG